MNLKFKMNIIGIVIIIISVLVDQLSKYMAIIKLKNQAPVAILKGIFELRYLENHGAAFGIFQHKQIIFVAIAIIILIAGINFYQKFPLEMRYIPIRLCILFVASGAIGNMIDRIRFGYVVDFFYFILINFPIFNVADIYVTISISFLIVLILFYYSDDDMKYFSLKNGEQ